MMKHLIYIFFVAGLLLSGGLQAQMRDDLWFAGQVQLDDGKIIEGKISFYTDHKTGLLQVNTGNKILAFDANQVVSFNFYDDKLEMHRRFYSLPYNRSEQDYDIMLFFEAMYEGAHISLLSKTVFRSENRTASYNPYRYRGYYIPRWYNDPYGPRTVNIMVPYETLYLVTPESPIKSYSEPTPLTSNRIRYRKADYDLLLGMMSDKRGAVESFVDKNKLDPREKTDLIKIVQYYNSLKSEAN